MMKKKKKKFSDGQQKEAKKSFRYEGRRAALPFEISPRKIDQISYLEIQKFSISGERG